METAYVAVDFAQQLGYVLATLALAYAVHAVGKSLVKHHDAASAEAYEAANLSKQRAATVYRERTFAEDVHKVNMQHAKDYGSRM